MQGELAMRGVSFCEHTEPTPLLKLSEGRKLSQNQGSGTKGGASLTKLLSFRLKCQIVMSDVSEMSESGLGQIWEMARTIDGIRK